jgi:hypothetical protein
MNCQRIQWPLAFLLFFGSFSVFSQSFVDDVDSLSRMLRNSSVKKTNKAISYHLAKGYPVVFAPVILRKTPYVKIATNFDLNYLVENKNGNDTLELRTLPAADSAGDSILMRIPLKYDYYFLTNYDYWDDEHPLVLSNPKGEFVENISNYAGNTGKTYLRTSRGDTVFAKMRGLKTPQETQYFNKNRFALEKPGSYMIPTDLGRDTIVLKNGTMEFIRIFSNDTSGAMSYQVRDTVEVRLPGNERIKIADTIITLLPSAISIFCNNRLIDFRFPLGSPIGSISKVFQKMPPTGWYLEVLPYAELADMTDKIGPTPKSLDLSLYPAEMPFNQIYFSKGDDILGSYQLDNLQFIRQLKYEPRINKVSFTAERTTNYDDSNSLNNHNLVTTSVPEDGLVFSQIEPDLNTTFFGTRYYRATMEADMRNLLDSFLVFQVSKDSINGIQKSRQVLKLDELKELQFKDGYYYEIKLDLQSVSDSMQGFALNDLNITIFTNSETLEWYPIFDDKLLISVESGVAKMLYSPITVRENYDFSAESGQNEDISVLLGSHALWKEEDRTSANVWGDISERYRDNPFLGSLLYNRLSKSSFEPLPGVSNDTLTARISRRIPGLFTWQNFSEKNVAVPGNNIISYEDLVKSYRTRITALDNLNLASDRFGTESNKLRRSVSTADVAAGLSDFIVDRAQEELNITFLDRMHAKLVKDTAEMLLLFPYTTAMMSQFQIIQYRTLLDFAKTSFHKDLQNLGVTFPKLFALPKYKKYLQNDPKVYNLFLLYDVANKVYEGMSVDTVLLHLHTRMVERRTELEKSISESVAQKILSCDSCIQMLDTLALAYSRTFNRVNNKSFFLSARYGEDHHELESSFNNQPGNMPEMELRAKIAALSIPLFQPFDITQYDYMRNNLKGDPDYNYLKNNLPFYQFQEYFNSEPKTAEVIGAGLLQSKNLLTTSRAWWFSQLADKMEHGQKNIENLELELSQSMGSNYGSLDGYLSFLFTYNQLMAKRLSLELALKAEQSYLADHKIHQEASFDYLGDVLQSPEKHQLPPYWEKIDFFTNQANQLGLDTIAVDFDHKHFLRLAFFGPGGPISEYEKFHILSVLSVQSDSLKQDFAKAQVFLDTIASSMAAQITRFPAARSADQQLLDSLSFSYFRTCKELWSNTLIFNYNAVRDEMQERITAVKNKSPLPEIDTVPSTNLNLDSKDPNKKLSNNQFLDNYSQWNRGFNLIQYDTEFNDSISDLRKDIAILDSLSRRYNSWLGDIRKQTAPKLLEALEQTEQFDTLTGVTLIWLYSLKSPKHDQQVISINDTTIQRVRTISEENNEDISFDRLVVNQKKVVEREWLTQQQFNRMMEDSMSRKVYLGLLYQQLQSIGTTNQFVPQNLALSAAKFMSAIYEVDDARARFALKKEAGTPLGFQDYFPFIRATVDLLNITLQTPLQRGVPSMQERYRQLSELPQLSDQTLSLFENVFAENYPNAIRNVANLLDIAWATSPDKNNDKAKSALLLYGSFMASMVQAQTPNQVKAAIQTVAVPPGYSSVKRNTRVNVAVNGYLGGSFANEFLQSDSISAGDARSRTVALTVPVGITATLGQTGYKGRQAFSIFCPIFDLAAITAYRLQQDNVQSDLPKVTISNFISPGAYLLYNFPKSPFSVGVGMQYGPQVRKITVDGVQKQSAAYRIGVTASFDVPLFNIYTRQFKNN